MSLFLNYESLTTGLLGYLVANSSTVNTGLASTIKYYAEFSPDVTALPNDKFPALSVDLKSHQEEADDIRHGRKKITTNWEIGCHVKTLNSHAIARQQMRILVSNVEHALRNDVALSTTFHEAQVTNSDFGVVINEQGVYQINGTIFLEGINYV